MRKQKTFKFIKLKYVLLHFIYKSIYPLLRKSARDQAGIGPSWLGTELTGTELDRKLPPIAFVLWSLVCDESIVRRTRPATVSTVSVKMTCYHGLALPFFVYSLRGHSFPAVHIPYVKY